jgi:RHS repeat-associated protein
VRLTQLSGLTVTSDKFYVWCGMSPCLETDALNHNAVTKRYLAEGLIDHGTPLYYGSDNLGSVRDLVDASGNVQASYDYQPYGVRTKLMGTEDSDYGFAGLFHESQSGLDLAVYRGYNASLGRWLNRDPIGEVGGLNLYAYVNNNPLDSSDPTGNFALIDNAIGGGIGVLVDLAAQGWEQRNQPHFQWDRTRTAVAFVAGFATSGLSAVLGKGVLSLGLGPKLSFKNSGKCRYRRARKRKFTDKLK